MSTPVQFRRADRKRWADALGCGTTHLPTWLTPEFVAEDGGRKLIADVEQHGATAYDESIDPALVLEALDHYGDEVAQHVIAHVVSKLPPPMRRHVVEQATIVSLGISMDGFCGPALSTTRPWLLAVCLSPGRDLAYFKSVLVHEVSHMWLERPKPAALAPRSFESSTIRSHPMGLVPVEARDRVEALRAANARSERLCRALTRRLGYADPSDFDTNSDAREVR
jgi:hypothetical protein